MCTSHVCANAETFNLLIFFALFCHRRRITYEHYLNDVSLNIENERMNVIDHVSLHIETAQTYTEVFSDIDGNVFQ